MRDDLISNLNYIRWLDRREFLGKMGTALGSIALACLLGEESAAQSPNHPIPQSSNHLAPHFPGKAKRVIQIFCPGAVSQMDTFEYKPELQKRHGQPMPGLTGVSSFQGGNGNLFKSPWNWKKKGKAGKRVNRELRAALAARW